MFLSSYVNSINYQSFVLKIKAVHIIVRNCIQEQSLDFFFPFLKVVFETVYLRLGLKLTWQGLCAMLNHSVVSNWDLRLAKTHSAWFRELMKLRFLMSLCKKIQ